MVRGDEKKSPPSPLSVEKGRKKGRGNPEFVFTAGIRSVDHPRFFLSNTFIDCSSASPVLAHLNRVFPVLFGRL